MPAIFAMPVRDRPQATRRRRMARHTVIFAIKMPDEISDEHVREWVEFELNFTGSMSDDNPMGQYPQMMEEIDPVRGSLVIRREPTR